MSGAFTHQMADNPSLISDPSSVHSALYPYDHQRADDQRPASLRLPSSRVSLPQYAGHVPSPTSTHYSPGLSHANARFPQSGPFGEPSDQGRPSHVSQDYPYTHLYRDQHAQMSSAAPYHTSEDTTLSGYPSTSYGAHAADDHSVGSHSSRSHSPPAPSAPNETVEQPQPSNARPAPRRREKPKIALAADQPLTTQGKPRARVYVACLQCRTRKIRCDGAKPVCHNCSRRTATGSEDLAPCTYDSTPKRRGPDKIPGSRQRLSAQETSEGGKVRRRRRRDTGTSDNPIPMAAHVHEHPVAEPGQAPVHDPSDTHAGPSGVLQSTHVEHSLHDIGESSSAGARVSEFYRAPQHRAPLVQSLSPTPPGHVPSLRGISHPSNTLQPIVAVSEPRFSHHPIPASTSRVQEFPHIDSIGRVTYPSYVSTQRASISHGTGEYEYDGEIERKPQIGSEPSVRLARDTWWDTLLGLYASSMNPRHPNGTALTPGYRDTLRQQITDDLRFLFRSSNYWFSFFNVPRFFARVLDPGQRGSLQPSLVLAALAAANLTQSSDQEAGEAGRSWSLVLLERAQASLEASLSSGWIDEGLVHASWLIAFFEITAHPLHNAPRVRSALSMLDSLIRSLAMASLDSADRRTSRFIQRAVPAVSTPPAYPAVSNTWDVPSSSSHIHGRSSRGECVCKAYTLGNNWNQAQELTPLWLMTPAWTKDASDAEVRKEECRRLVWSSVTMIAGYTSFLAANNTPPTMDLFLMESANYALLFPGEAVVAPISSTASKETVWALYMRTMLLWHSCMRMRWDATRTDAEKAQFAVSAWLEIDKIEEALDSHTCEIERAFLFQGREYLFNARMCISFEFRRFIPQPSSSTVVFHRQKAEEWLKHQASVAKRTMYGLQTVTGQPNVTLARRPFFVFWFMSQVNRALLLWNLDNTLSVALDVAKALLGPIEYLMSVWPCPEQRKRYSDLRANLDHACYSAGLPPPPPHNIPLPVPAA